jgi:hypothetical protein
VNRDTDSASHWEYVEFDEWELKDKLRDFAFALLRSGGTRRRIGTLEEQTMNG